MPILISSLSFNTDSIAFDSVLNKSYNVAGISSVIDPTYGVVASLTGAGSALTIPSGSVRPALYNKNRYYIISTWVKVESGNTATIHRIGTNNTNTNVVVAFGSNTSLSFFNTSIRYTDVAFDDNQWHHVALSRNVKEWKLYVDGNIIIYKDSSNYTTGKSSQVMGKFAGNLLDYRVYTGVHADSDVLEIYNNGPDTIIPSNAEILSITPMSSTIVVKVDNPSGLDLVLEVDGQDFTMTSDEIIIRDVDPGMLHEMVLRTY